MNKFLLTLLVAGLATQTHAAPTQESAQAMAARALQLVQEKGQSELLKRIQAKDPAFLDAGLYLEMQDLYTGIVLANPVNPGVIGRDRNASLSEPQRKIQRAILVLAQDAGAGWIEQHGTGPLDPSATYVQRHKDVVLRVAQR